MHQSSHYIKFGTWFRYKDRPCINQVSITPRSKSNLSRFKETFSHIAFWSVFILSITASFSIQQEAYAQLKEVEVKEPSIEQKVDQVFGTIVHLKSSVKKI